MPCKMRRKAGCWNFSSPFRNRFRSDPPRRLHFWASARVICTGLGAVPGIQGGGRQEFPMLCVALPLGGSFGFLVGILHRSHGPHLSSSYISYPTFLTPENNDPPTILLTALVGRRKYRRSLIVLYTLNQFNTT